MEKRPDEYRQFEQFGLANAQKPQKKQYHEVIGFPANSDQPQPYVPTYQWLPQTGTTQRPDHQQSQAQVAVSQKSSRQQGTLQRNSECHWQERLRNRRGQSQCRKRER